ncbi:hypothetical protein [Ruminiclostridium josui]|uniref:hypothetical protein n=1 Tax=Ruminiclostridium josui TaxID=1499 RepID=UPI00046509A8|nr:hypothetical protein [Ruminiclostridium josui]
MEAEIRDKICKKIIPKIEPFGEFYYFNCFYSSLIPVILLYNKSIMPILINGIFTYRINHEIDDLCLCAGYEHITNLKDILNEQGIVLNAKEKSNCIIDDIINSISSERPVITWVDCFYESIRDDLYMKEHWRHSILYYGFDLSERLFYIIEHDKRDDIEYRKKTISFEDVINSYQGYLKHFHQNNTMSYIDFSCLNLISDKVDMEQYKNKYLENFRLSKKKIDKGLVTLKDTIDKLLELIDDEDLLSQKCEKILLGFNDIIEAKRTEKYLVTRLFGESNTKIAMLDEVATHWKAVRAVFARYIYSNIYRQKSFFNAKNSLKDICNIELEYYGSMLKL